VRKLQNEHASQVEKLKQDDSVGNVAIIFDLFERPIKSVSIAIEIPRTCSLIPLLRSIIHSNTTVSSALSWYTKQLSISEASYRHFLFGSVNRSGSHWRTSCIGRTLDSFTSWRNSRHCFLNACKPFNDPSICNLLHLVALSALFAFLLYQNNTTRDSLKSYDLVNFIKFYIKRIICDNQRRNSYQSEHLIFKRSTSRVPAMYYYTMQKTGRHSCVYQKKSLEICFWKHFEN